MWLPKLKSMRIMDLAEIFSAKYGKPIEVIGMRPGEKLHEDLISPTESIRVRDEDGYYKMDPAHSSVPAGGKLFDKSTKMCRQGGVGDVLAQFGGAGWFVGSVLGRERGN